MAEFIGLFFTYLGLVLLIIAACIAFVLARNVPAGQKAVVWYRWISLLSVGFLGIYTFVMHAFFPEIASANIGWARSPFEYEVAVANLAVGLLAVVAFCKQTSHGFRVASVLAAAVWYWGDAVGHIYQMLVQHNFTAGNAGVWFWMDVIVPIVLIALLVNSKKGSN